MSARRAGSAMRRPRRRSFGRKSPALRWAIVAALAVALVALGVYYVGEYRRRAEYAQYPFRFREEIVAAAREFELEPWHVAAVVRCESSFREQALSGAGAMGLMQIMPETGSWIAGKLGEKDTYADENLYRPEFNLRYGCWYLHWLMERYHGDRTLVTAAYHAGQGTVDKWLADGEVSADGQTLTTIPYDSTRVYVQRVLAACEKYRTMYDFDEPAEAA